MTINQTVLLAGAITGAVLVFVLVWLLACGPVASPPPATATPVPTVPAGYQRLCYVTGVRLSCPWGTQDCGINYVVVDQDIECVVVPVWRP